MIAALFAAGILLIVLGTGADLVLGVTTNIYSDFLSAHKGFLGVIPPVKLLRICAMVVLLPASMLVFTGLDSTILKWSYMSMGLRGSAVFVGLFILVFLKKYAHSTFILALLYLIPVIYLLLQIL